MNVLFANAWYNPDRYMGSRVHTEAVLHGFEAAGHKAWVPAESPVTCGRRLAVPRLQKARQLARMDICYYRMEGFPPCVTAFDRVSAGILLKRAPMVWEVNAASDLRALRGDRVDACELASLDMAIKRQARRVALAICNTNGLARFSADMGIRRTVTIPLGADPDRFSSSGRCDSVTCRDDGLLNVVWMGNTAVPWHDLDLLARAARRLQSAPHIRFFIVGPPPECAFPDNVTLVGEIAYDCVPSFLGKMDVGLALYRRGDWSRYGVFSSPLKLFDYLAARLVAVSSPIEQMETIIQHGFNGFLIPYGDDSALSDRLLWIAAHRNELDSLRAAGRKQVTSFFNWDRVIRDMVTAIESLYARRGC